MFVVIELKKDPISAFAKYCVKKGLTLLSGDAEILFTRKDYEIAIVESAIRGQEWMMSLRCNSYDGRKLNLVNMIEVIESTMVVIGKRKTALEELEHLIGCGLNNRIIRESETSRMLDLENHFLVMTKTAFKLYDENLDVVSFDEIELSSNNYENMRLKHTMSTEDAWHIIRLGDITETRLIKDESRIAMPKNKDYTELLNREIFKMKSDLATLENISIIKDKLKELKTEGELALTEKYLFWKIDNVKLFVPKSRRDNGTEWNEDYSINLGNFIIRWKIGTTEFYFSNTNNKHPEGYQAPHVFSSGNPCFGTYDELIAQCVETLDIEMMLHILLDYLGTANPEDQIGMNWTWWAKEDGFDVQDEIDDDGERCTECGGYYDTDYMRMLSNYRGFICNDCWSESYCKCEQCEEEFKKDVMTRSVDNYYYCEECSEESLFVCDKCGDNVRKDDSALIEYTNGKEMSVCYSCADEMKCTECGSCHDIDYDTNLCEDCMKKEEE